MTFQANTISIAAGAFRSADYADGVVRVIVSDGCACKAYRYDLNARIKSGGEVVSYSDECAFVPGGRVERRGRLYYVAT